jgi:hypothetical protein
MGECCPSRLTGGRCSLLSSKLFASTGLPMGYSKKGGVGEMRWDMVGWDGMGWDGMGWDGRSRTAGCGVTEPMDEWNATTNLLPDKRL